MSYVDLSGTFVSADRFDTVRPNIDDQPPIDLTGEMSGSSTVWARLSGNTPIYDAFIDLTKQVPLGMTVLPSSDRPIVRVIRSKMCWLGPPLVEYHDDRSSSVVTIPTVGDQWTVVSGGTVYAVNGVPTDTNPEDDIFDGVYTP
jgi:hypothetical protein